jgi:signal transduction histidine kinase/ketosteroid isomerase-like protein
VGSEPGELPARFHRAFNDRDFDAWREILAEDVELIVDGTAFRGIDATVTYGMVSTSQSPGLHISSERVIADTGDVAVVEFALTNGAPDGGQVRAQGTSCEIWRLRGGRGVSIRTYYMPEPGDTVAEVRVPSRGEAAVIAEERAALRRVAALVAADVPEEELFAAVTQEVGWLVSADATSLLHFEPDDTVTLVAAWMAGPAEVPIGASRPVDDVLRSIRDTGAPWRSSGELPPTGPFVEEARELGLRTFVGVPIPVAGRVWGVVVASSAADQPFAADAEGRLAAFVELIATAIANAQSRLRLREHADAQAALRRVATLIARGAAPTEAFSAVAAEVGQLLAADFSVLSRYDPDGSVTVVGGWAREDPGSPLEIGLRFEPGERDVHALVLRTGAPARIDGPEGEASSVGVPIGVAGHPWGVMIVGSRARPLPNHIETGLVGFTELVATAIANTEAQVALGASRARMVAAADAARRRLQRDLHDGAQQRLVSLALRLRSTLRRTMPADVRADVESVAEEVTGALEDLRELVGGLHPAVLGQGGLRPALMMLARRSGVPARLDVRVEGRLPEPVGLAAYYAVAEALTNMAKHAAASTVDITAETGEGLLRVRVRDDGRGGAEAAAGSGLSGLIDRVEALGGRLALHSPPGGGTTMEIELPLDDALRSAGTGGPARPT